MAKLNRSRSWKPRPRLPSNGRAAIASMARRSSIRIRIPVAPLPSSDTQPTNSLASNSAATLNTAQARNFKYVWLDLCRVRLTVAKELADLHERGAAAQQVGGERVAQQVCALELGRQPGALERATNDAANNRRTYETSSGRAYPNENVACRANRPISAQIVDQGRADIHRQWQPCQSLTFAMHDNLSAFPVEIV